MKIVTIWLFVLYFLACGHNYQQQSMPIAVTPHVKKAKVTLRIYSGRENPSWDLSEKQIGELLALVGDLPKSEAFTLPDNLGYQGFHVELTENAAEKTEEMIAYKGRVIYRSAQAGEYFSDREKRLEMFLLNSAASFDEKFKKFVKDRITAEEK